MALFGGTFQVLAAQEVPDTASARFLQSLLPRSPESWTTAFVDTTSSHDNGIWSDGSISISNQQLWLGSSLRDALGRITVDPALVRHPPQALQIRAGDFDFVLVSLHLTFADGDTFETAREFKAVLDVIDDYFSRPDSDPDLVICGDFNIPSRLSGQTGAGGLTLDDLIEADGRFSHGIRRFAVTIHEPTSRSSFSNGGLPSHNYDHCLLSADTMEEFVLARRVSLDLLTSDFRDPEETLTSDHLPIVAFFRTKGDGIFPDRLF